MHKRLGVIGGLGPLATACFYELMIGMTDAKCDQEHPDVMIYSHPATPDRTRFIVGESDEDPLPDLVYAGKLLCGAGADYIAMPCVTAFGFYDRLQSELSVPVIHLIRETADILRESGVGCAGIMATDGTVKCGLFQRTLEAAGIRAVTPNAEAQKKVMSVIYNNVKAGLPVNRDDFGFAAEQLRSEGAEVIILGCTELSPAKRECGLGGGYIDVLEVLAKRSLELCGYPVKEQFKNLITK